MPPTDPAQAPGGETRSVLLLSQLPPPYGGLAVHTERLRATLEDRGWQVELLSPPGAHSTPPGHFRRLRAQVTQIRFLIRLLRRRCTLVHDHVSTYAIGGRSPRTVVPHVAMLLALRFGASPWVVTCGNGRLPSLLAAVPPRLRRLLRWLYSGASFAIAKNTLILEAFEMLGLAGRVQVIGTFLEPVRSASNPPLSAEVEAYLAAHPLCVMSAGFRFEPLYHLDAVARAVGHLRQAAPARGLPGRAGLVVLASHAEDAVGKPAFDTAVVESGLEGGVLVLRDVSNALDVISRASVFVRATDHDGDANTVKEAMLLRVPVLATDLPGRPPGIELIARGDLANLGPRLLETIVSRDGAQLEAARAFVEEDIERNTAAILTVYDRVGGA